MRKIFVSPSRYIQGKDELRNLAEYIKPFGTRAFVLISARGIQRSVHVLEDGFIEHKSTLTFSEFGGEISQQEIERQQREFKKGTYDVVVGIGGGKILDTAKALAHYQSAPVVVCPTNAASDAACSAHSIIYTPSGTFDSFLHFPKNPDIVLVDTGVIAKSPLRLTVAGMGDALATYFEAQSVIAKDADNYVGGKATLAGLAIARLSYEVLLSHSASALEALRAGVVTQAVEKIIEANTLLSGLGFENCGVAAAHALHNGLTILKETQGCYHGEKVAFGVLTLLIIEDYPREVLDEVYGFCLSVGLPVTLGDLGIHDASRKNLMQVAELSCSEGQPMKKSPVAVSPDSVIDAMLAADAMGKCYKHSN